MPGVDAQCVCLALLCFFMPPLGIFVKENCSVNVWIDLVLCLLMWFPGMLFSFYVVFASGGGGGK